MKEEEDAEWMALIAEQQRFLQSGEKPSTTLVRTHKEPPAAYAAETPTAAPAASFGRDVVHLQLGPAISLSSANSGTTAKSKPSLFARQVSVRAISKPAMAFPATFEIQPQPQPQPQPQQEEEIAEMNATLEHQPQEKEPRFGFDGRALTATESSAIAVTAGLHHHGLDPDSAGYTLDEITMLCRSSVPAQRVANYTILSHILARAWLHDLALLRTCLRSHNVAIAIRMGLDQTATSVAAAASLALRALLCHPCDSAILTHRQHHFRGLELAPMAPARHPSTLHPPKKSTKHDDDDDDDDDDDNEDKDVIAMLMVQTHLHIRIAHLLHQRIVPTAECLWHVLQRLALHSPAAAHAVFFDPPSFLPLLQRTLADTATPEPVLTACLRLLRLLAASSRQIATALLDACGPSLPRFLASHADWNPHDQTNPAFEAMALYRVFLAYGFAADLVATMYSTLHNLGGSDLYFCESWRVMEASVSAARVSADYRATWDALTQQLSAAAQWLRTDIHHPPQQQQQPRARARTTAAVDGGRLGPVSRRRWSWTLTGRLPLLPLSLCGINAKHASIFHFLASYLHACRPHAKTAAFADTLLPLAEHYWCRGFAFHSSSSSSSSSSGAIPLIASLPSICGTAATAESLAEYLASDDACNALTGLARLTYALVRTTRSSTSALQPQSVDAVYKVLHALVDSASEGTAFAVRNWALACYYMLVTLDHLDTDTHGSNGRARQCMRVGLHALATQLVPMFGPGDDCYAAHVLSHVVFGRKYVHSCYPKTHAAILLASPQPLLSFLLAQYINKEALVCSDMLASGDSALRLPSLALPPSSLPLPSDWQLAPFRALSAPPSLRADQLDHLELFVAAALMLMFHERKSSYLHLLLVLLWPGFPWRVGGLITDLLLLNLWQCAARAEGGDWLGAEEDAAAADDNDHRAWHADADDARLCRLPATPLQLITTAVEVYMADSFLDETLGQFVVALLQRHVDAHYKMLVVVQCEPILPRLPAPDPAFLQLYAALDVRDAKEKRLLSRILAHPGNLAGTFIATLLPKSHLK